VYVALFCKDVIVVSELRQGALFEVGCCTHNCWDRMQHEIYNSRDHHYEDEEEAQYFINVIFKDYTTLYEGRVALIIERDRVLADNPEDYESEEEI
jgi:hypothetical protein